MLPELPRNSGQIKVDRFRAFGFVDTAIDDTIVGAAKGNRELVAQLCGQSARLRESWMIGHPTSVRKRHGCEDRN
jgi:hypothetical protein